MSIVHNKVTGEVHDISIWDIEPIGVCDPNDDLYYHLWLLIQETVRKQQADDEQREREAITAWCHRCLS